MVDIGGSTVGSWVAIVLIGNAGRLRRTAAEHLRLKGGHCALAIRRIIRVCRANVRSTLLNYGGRQGQVTAWIGARSSKLWQEYSAMADELCPASGLGLGLGTGAWR